MKTPTHLRLHRSRMAQLKSIAEANNLGMSEALEGLISRELEKQPEIDRIPSLIISSESNTVFVEADGIVPLAISRYEADKFASAIRFILDVGDSKAAEFVADDTRIVVGRRGRAVSVELTQPNGGRAFITLTTSLAEDLMRQLKRAASGAEVAPHV